MDRNDNSANELDPQLRAEIVAFLREWLPRNARTAYREMISRDPVNWSRHPHFAGGVILEHALRGNGITEKAVGVRDLEPLWPGLLRDAVAEIPPDGTD